MRLFKKITACICLLIFTTVVFVGCSFIELDVVRFRNDPVAVTKSGEVLARTGDLIDAYNSYGYQYNTQYGLSVNESLNKTLELLINRKIVLKAAAADGIALTPNDKLRVKKTVYGYIDDALLEIEDEIRVAWERTITRPVYPEVKSYDAYSPYQPAVVWASDVVFDSEIHEEIAGSDFIKVKQKEEPLGFVPNSWVQTISDEDISSEALNRLARVLRNQRKGMGFENKSNLEVIKDEIEKSIKTEEENMILQKFQDKYERGANVGDGVILDRYSQLVVNQYKQWQSGSLNEETFTTNMIENNALESLYYMPSNLSKDFFTVTHVLVKFDEESNARINEWKEMLLAGDISSEEDFNVFRDGEIGRLYANERYLKESGEYITDERAGQVIGDGNKKLVTDILAELQTADADTFRDYIYMYGEDPGMLNNRFGYTMSSEKADNQMIEQFTEECLNLYNRSVGYRDDKGVYHAPEGDNLVSDKLVFTEVASGEYGVHIIFFDRLVDFVNVVNITELSSVSAKTLYDVKISSYTEESFYHVVRSQVANSNYSVFEQNIVDTYRSKVTITIYKDKIKEAEKQR